MYDFDGKMHCDCPKCGGLATVDNSVVLTSFPQQFEYRCPSCDDHGYIRCEEAFYLGVKRDNMEFYKELQAEQQEQM